MPPTSGGLCCHARSRVRVNACIRARTTSIWSGNSEWNRGRSSQPCSSRMMSSSARGCCSTRATGTNRGPLIAIAPGAAYGTAKRWLPEHYASLVSSLVHGGTQCVLVGSKADVETTNWIQRLVPDNERQDVLDLTGVTSLSLLVGVMAIARGFVSNDSGAMHLAAAVGAGRRDFRTDQRARDGDRCRRRGRARAPVLITTTYGAVPVCCVSARSIIAA